MLRGRVADAEASPSSFCGGQLPTSLVNPRDRQLAWAVTKIILHPSLPISPTMTVVRASQNTSAGIATYANSITLTPGTITVGVNGKELVVHALAVEGALDLEEAGWIVASAGSKVAA